MAVSVGIGRYVKRGCSKALVFLDGGRGYIHTFFVEYSHIAVTVVVFLFVYSKILYSSMFYLLCCSRHDTSLSMCCQISDLRNQSCFPNSIYLAY